jgi:CHAT domain-containing protein/Tfp pilus assembly protein PilF
MTAAEAIRLLLLAAALALWPCSLALAQSKQADAISARVEELYKAGKYADALPLAQQALAVAEEEVGRENWTLARPLNNLAQIYERQGRLADAELMYRRALALYEKAVGANHPYVATALDNVADVLAAENRAADAEPLYKRALAIREKALGADHVDVAQSLTNLGMLYYKHNGRPAQAEPLLRRALAIRERALKPDDIAIAASCERLGAVLDDQGHHTEAEPLYQRALAVREKARGPDDVTVAVDLSSVAQIYAEENRYADADPLYRRALAIQEKARGLDHLDVATTLYALAKLDQRQGRYGEAEQFYKRAIAIREKTLGSDHADVVAVQNDFASLDLDQGRFADAEAMFKRTLMIEEKAFGPDHPDVATALNNLAAVYDSEARYSDAEPLYRRSLAIREKSLGPDHPDVATSLNNLAVLYAEQGRYADAEPLHRRALAIREKTLSADDPELANSINNLATTLRREGRYADAELLYKRGLLILQKAFGADHPEIAQALNNLANVYRDEHRYGDAESLYRRALAIEEKTLGPDHPNVAHALNDLAVLYDNQSRTAEAEPLYERALAIDEKALGPDHPDVAAVLNNLIFLYNVQGRATDALPLIRRTISNNTAVTWAALPILFGARAANLIAGDEAIDDGLNVVQRASQTDAGKALNALAARFSAGNDRLAQLVRKYQDLAAESSNLDKAIIAAVSNEPSKRDAAAEQRIKDRIAAIAKERADLQTVFAREFPDYAALSNPRPLTVKDIQALLGDDEALIVIDLGIKQSYVWAITRSAADWKELAVWAADVSKKVSALRALLKFDTAKPFDTQASFELYQKLLGPVEDVLRGKARLSFVLNGALSSLPPQLLVTRDPTGKTLKDVDWLLRTHAVTVLPSVASLKVLRGKSASADAEKPLIGFADPVFDQQNVRVAADVTAARGIRGTVADIAELRTALPPLPETADELRKVAASVHANPADVFLGPNATESRVKQAKLDQFRIVYFATHGLLAGDVADFAKLNAEPALVLSLPEHPTEFDDGLLTASEVAQLKLNADWVVLSACNTASAEKPGAEALSGLARAFFYAGARSLIVSNWEVNSDSAVSLMVGTFAALAADPKLSHAEALRKSMLAMIDQHPEQADPKYWAPFVIVGEPTKPAN